MTNKRQKFNGLTDEQVFMLFERIATHANMMASICRAEALRNDENYTSMTFQALDVMLCGVGAMADHATGGECVGDFAAWMVGPLFHPVQRVGSDSGRA